MIEKMSPIATRIFRRVEASASQRGARAVIVYLPTEADYFGPISWETWLVGAMKGIDMPFVNLAPDLRELSADVVKSHFIPVGDPGETHYTRSGNQWAAQTLNRALRELGLPLRGLTITPILGRGAETQPESPIPTVDGVGDWASMSELRFRPGSIL
jgi:hypothetical protein